MPGVLIRPPASERPEGSPSAEPSAGPPAQRAGWAGERPETWPHDQGATIADDVRRVSEHCGYTWPRRILPQVRPPLPPAMLPVQEAVRPTDASAREHEVYVLPQGWLEEKCLGLGGGIGWIAGAWEACVI